MTAHGLLDLASPCFGHFGGVHSFGKSLGFTDEDGDDEEEDETDGHIDPNESLSLIYRDVPRTS